MENRNDIKNKKINLKSMKQKMQARQNLDVENILRQESDQIDLLDISIGNNSIQNTNEQVMSNIIIKDESIIPR